MSVEINKQDNTPAPWGSEPIRGLDYSFLEIEEPPAVTPEPVMPEPTIEFNAKQAEDYYNRVRTKIVGWAERSGAGKKTTDYILLVPDVMAMFVRMMGDPRISAQLKAEIAAASAYIIVPIDLMPELALGPAGLIDDVIVGMIALNRVVAAMGEGGREVALDHWSGDANLFEKMEEVLTEADQFVTGTVWTGIKKFMADVGSEAKVAVEKARDAAQQQKPRQIDGPVVGSRPILPSGEGSSSKGDDNDSRPILPPNERG
ncbi:MAG: YkvA family protein [Anaerolineae bacterium]